MGAGEYSRVSAVQPSRMCLWTSWNAPRQVRKTQLHPSHTTAPQFCTHRMDRDNTDNAPEWSRLHRSCTCQGALVQRRLFISTDISLFADHITFDRVLPPQRLKICDTCIRSTLLQQCLWCYPRGTCWGPTASGQVFARRLKLCKHCLLKTIKTTDMVFWKAARLRSDYVIVTNKAPQWQRCHIGWRIMRAILVGCEVDDDLVCGVRSTTSALTRHIIVRLIIAIAQAGHGRLIRSTDHVRIHCSFSPKCRYISLHFVTCRYSVLFRVLFQQVEVECCTERHERLGRISWVVIRCRCCYAARQYWTT